MRFNRIDVEKENEKALHFLKMQKLTLIFNIIGYLENEEIHLQISRQER